MPRSPVFTFRRPRTMPDPSPRYRSRRAGTGGESRWDPYAADQSRVHRVRAARRSHQNRPTGSELDYYALLGLERGASDEQIERAYRHCAALIHPDKFYDNPARRLLAEQQLKQLNAAMQVLRDPVRRAQYDASL